MRRLCAGAAIGGAVFVIAGGGVVLARDIFNSNSSGAGGPQVPVLPCQLNGGATLSWSFGSGLAPPMTTYSIRTGSTDCIQVQMSGQAYYFEAGNGNPQFLQCATPQPSGNSINCSGNITFVPQFDQPYYLGYTASALSRAGIYGSKGGVCVRVPAFSFSGSVSCSF